LQLYKVNNGLSCAFKNLIFMMKKTNMMNKIFTLLLMFLATMVFYRSHAQCGTLAATVNTLESRCTSTGSIIINASGGMVPENYQYRISDGPVTTPYTSSTTISGLPPGTYTIMVRDVTANCTMTIPNNLVQGSYAVPGIFYNSSAITCMNGTDGAIFVTNQTGGRAPFSYQIIAPSASQVSTISNNGTFTGLMAGSYRIQMTDSCGGIQTRDQVVGSYSWSFNTNPTVTKPTCNNIHVSISLKNSNNVISPNAVYTGFQYGVSRYPGDTTWFAASPFDFTIGVYRTVKILVKDNCGSNVLSYTWTDPQPSLFNFVSVTNKVCSGFTATVFGQTNITPASTTYCLYDITNTIPLGICQSSPIFNNLSYGSYTIRTTDACYDTTITRTVTASRPIPSVSSNVSIANTCSGFTATITGQTNINNVANNYCLYINGNAIASLCNSTGIFTGLNYGVPYCITLQNDPACYDTLISRCFTATRPIQSLAANVTISGATCSSFNVSIGGQNNLNNPWFCLYDQNNVQVGVCNSTGTFTNIPNGTYCIKMQNDPACYDTLISRCFTVDKQIPALNNTVTRNNRTCTTFTATLSGQSNITNPIYRLFDGANNIQIGADQSSPVFTILPYGSYCIRMVNDAVCYDTTIVRCFTETAPPAASISLNALQTCNLIGGTDIKVNFVGGISPFISKIYSPAGILLSTSMPQSGGSYTFSSMPGIPTGTLYKVVTTDACGSKDSATVAPNVYYINRTITKTAKCPSGTNPNGTGDVTISVNFTENIGGFYVISIIKKDGAVFNQAATSTASFGKVANFLGLTPATYIFLTDPNNCGTTANRYDTVIIPNYVYPNLINSIAFGCDNGSQSVVSAVTGGAPPYQYQIFSSVPASPEITTPYQNTPVFNINNGTVYSLIRIRVIDNCGNASINDVAFQPIVNPTIEASSNCMFTPATLSVDSIPGATYTWYKRTYNPFDSVYLGTGREYLIPYMQPSDTGKYICKTVFAGGCATRLSYKTVTGLCFLLPVTLTDFKATWKHVYSELNWQVSTMINFSHFEIERSLDGTSFSKTGQVMHQSNQWSYSYDDRNIPAGASVLYYRLRLVDMDGRFSYSPVVVIRLNGGKNNINIYPNPSTNYMNAELGSEARGDYQVQLIDAVGQVVETKVVTNAQANQVVTIQRGKHASGIYILKIESSYYRQTSLNRVVFK
jgi:hypothetical protein